MLSVITAARSIIRGIPNPAQSALSGVHRRRHIWNFLLKTAPGRNDGGRAGLSHTFWIPQRIDEAWRTPHPTDDAIGEQFDLRAAPSTPRRTTAPTRAFASLPAAMKEFTQVLVLLYNQKRGSYDGWSSEFRHGQAGGRLKTMPRPTASE
jgi:hypothetical protein